MQWKLHACTQCNYTNWHIGQKKKRKKKYNLHVSDIILWLVTCTLKGNILSGDLELINILRNLIVGIDVRLWIYWIYDVQFVIVYFKCAFLLVQANLWITPQSFPVVPSWRIQCTRTSAMRKSPSRSTMLVTWHLLMSEFRFWVFRMMSSAVVNMFSQNIFFYFSCVLFF